MEDDFELVHGSGNIFADFGEPDPQLEQFRVVLAAQVIRVLNERKLSVRQAQELTGVAAADFSRIRRAKFGRFTIDRLLRILDRLGQQVDIDVQVTPKPETAAAKPKAA